MLHNSSLQFIYTPCLCVSHIMIIHEEPEVLMFGLYGNLLDNEMQELVLQAGFSQLNDLLDLADYVADETIEHLANVVSSGITAPQTIDVTDSGGINFNDLLFCLQPIPLHDEEPDHVLQDKTEYYIYAFMKKDKSVPDFEVTALPSNGSSRLNYYLFVLSLQYDFYLFFTKQKMETNLALQYAGLQNALIFELAKTGYELRQKMQV